MGMVDELKSANSLKNGLEKRGLLTNNKFIFALGSLVTSFSRVSGIGRSVQYDTQFEGGNNEFGYVIRKNLQPESNIIKLEKGVGRVNPLIKAAEGEVPLGIKLPLPGTIIVLDDNYEVAQIYSFDDIVILKWETSDLDAKGSEVFIDKIELMHSGLKKRNL